MKKIVTFIAFITLLSMNSHAQSSWIRQLPDNGEIVKMIPTIDGKYALLAYTTDKYIIYKYDDAGNMEWRKESLPKNMNQINDFIQLSNGYYVISGANSNSTCYNAYISLLNSVGDSIWYRQKTYCDSIWDCGYYKALQINENEFLSTLGVSYNEPGTINFHYIVKFDLSGNDTAIEQSVFTYPVLKYNNDTFLLCSKLQSYPNKYSLKKVDYNFNIIVEKSYFITPNFLQKISNNGLIMHDAHTCSVLDNKGLVRFNSYLDSMFTIPFIHYVPQPAFDYAYSPSDLITTYSEGFAMCGLITTGFNQNSVYFLKTDEWGNQESFCYYSGAIPNHVVNILQSPDGGFVMFQRAGSNHTLWLVKINEDGTLPVEKNSTFYLNDVLVFPNPATDFIIINFNDNFNGELNIYNIVGQQVKNYYIYNEKQNQINISELPKGIYILKISNSSNRSVITKKIIKQ